jgi:hypothetical protein
LTQVRRGLTDIRSCLMKPDGQKVEHGYVAVLDWKIGSLVARLHSEKVLG